MNHQAGSFFLPVNARSTCPNGSGLRTANACQLHRKKTDFVCLDNRARKSFNHANLVTAVTDSHSFALLMSHYSASSSEARQALLPEKFELIRAGGASISGRPPRVIRIRMAAQKRQPANGPHREQNDKRVRLYLVQLTQRPNSQNSTT